MTLVALALLLAVPAAFLLGRAHERRVTARRYDGRLRELDRLESLRRLPPAAPGRPRPPARRR